MNVVLPFQEGLSSNSAIEAILKGDEVTLRYPAILDSRFNFISGFLYRLLSRFDMGFLSELLLVLLKEITSNCSKANAKRIYFKEHQITVNGPADYDNAIKLFAQDVLAEWDDYILKHRNEDLYIALNIKMEGEQLRFEVENNVELLPREAERIETRLASFEKYKDIEKAFSEIRDSSEGAGLGIVMILLLLQNAGIPSDHFTIESAAGKTSTRIRIPRNLTAGDLKQRFKEQILNEIEELPYISENITNLIRLCNSDNATVKVIAERIQKDPGLTAQMLKMVNSAGYMNRFRNPTLSDAVKIIGLKVLRNLLLVTGARNAVNSRYRMRELEQIWEGSNRVSFFARNLAERKPAIRDMAAVAGLLFELGKIILISLNPDLIKKIHELMGAGRIRNSSVIEEVSLGMSHPEIGMLTAKKWNFPEPLIAVIRYQQKPLEAPEEYVDLVHVVYMAIRIQEASQHRGDYYAVEPDILQAFGITSQKQFDEMVERMDKLYDSDGSAI